MGRFVGPRLSMLLEDDEIAEIVSALAWATGVANVAYSNGNRTAAKVTNSADRVVLGSVSMSLTDKKMWEITVDGIPGGGANNATGIADALAIPWLGGGGGGGAGGHTYAMYSTGSCYYNGASAGSEFGWGATAGVTLLCVYDGPTNKYYAYNPVYGDWGGNGTGSDNPLTNTGGYAPALMNTPVYPALGIYGPGDQATINGTVSTFVNAPQAAALAALGFTGLG